MKHLTEQQIQSFVDATADYMTQATCTNHLATCERCRREVELQKALLRTARRSGLMMPSRSFTRRVMASIVPSRRRVAVRWVLDNMGAMFAMMAVLGVTGSVVFGDRSEGLTMPTLDLTSGADAASRLWEGFSGVVGSLLGMVNLPPISGEGNLVLVATSVIALVLLDRMLRTKIGALVRR